MSETAPSQIDAIRTLCSFIADGIRKFRGDALPDQVLMHLRIWRTVVETGSVSTVWCDECDAGHLAEVAQDPAGTDIGWTCPEVGFVAASKSALRGFDLKFDDVAKSLADKFTDPRSFDPLDHLVGIWRLGQRPLATGRAEVLMMSQLSTRADMDRLQSVIDDLPPANARIVLVAADAAETLEPIKGLHDLPLQDLLVAQAGELRIDAAEFDLRVEKFLLRSPPGASGRPSQKEQTWQTLEWLRTRSLLKEGRNERVRLVEHYWPDVFAGETAPPSSTLEKHVTQFQKMDSKGSV